MYSMQAALLLITMIGSILIINTFANNNSIGPTISNSSGDYYITSLSFATNYSFTNGSINCNKNINCIIKCDVPNSCHTLNINSSLSNNFIFECSKYNSCFNSSLITTPINNNTIKCTNQYSCNYTKINVFGENNNIYLYCSNVSSCTNTSILSNTTSASSINSLTIHCTDNACYKSNFDLSSFTNGIKIFNLYCSGASNGADKPCSVLKINPNIIQKGTITCSGTYSCDAAAITANIDEYTNVDIECSSYRDSSCRGMKLLIEPIKKLSTNKGNISIICGDETGCETAEFFFLNIGNVLIECNGDDSCGMGSFSGETVESFNISCNYHSSCNSLHVYCPSITNNQCVINCAGDNMCNYMNIYSSESYKYDYLNINCDSSNCEYLLFYCNVGYNYSQISNSNIKKQTQYYDKTECWDNPITSCCPWYNIDDNNIKPIECDTNSANCIIDCNDKNKQNCTANIINATSSSSLTVLCGDGICSNSIIYCPDKECNVNCMNKKSCSNTIINYYGNDGNVKLNCSNELSDDDMSCSDISLYASYANNIDIICKNTKCFGINVYGEYANNININCYESTCGSNNKYFISDHGNITFNCTGLGCNTFGDIYVNTKINTNTIFNIYGTCNCNNTQQCMNNNTIKIYCNSTYTHDGYIFGSFNEIIYNNYQYFDGKNCYSQSKDVDCGCNNLLNKTTFFPLINHNNDNSTILCPDNNNKSNKHLIYYIIAGGCCILLILIGTVVIFVYYRERKKQSKTIEDKLLN